MTTTDAPADVVGEGDAVGVTIPGKPTTALPDDALAWLGLIRQCDQQIKDFEETKRIARSHIEQLLGEHEVGTVGGKPVVRWTIVPATRLDTTKLKAEQPDVYEAFARTSVTRRFTIVDPE